MALYHIHPLSGNFIGDHHLGETKWLHVLLPQQALLTKSSTILVVIRLLLKEKVSEPGVILLLIFILFNISLQRQHLVLAYA